jgi:hypothetical protein
MELGGEVAADRLTGQLKPARVTLYVWAGGPPRRDDCSGPHPGATDRLLERAHSRRRCGMIWRVRAADARSGWFACFVSMRSARIPAIPMRVATGLLKHAPGSR